MDQTENLLWLAQHKRGEQGWKEHYESLVASIMNEQKLDRQTAEVFANKTIDMQRKAAGR